MEARAELLKRLATQGRVLNLAMTGLSHAAAARLGLQAIDQQCLGLLHLAGPKTVGELARMAGLTASSITGVVDRLERAGYAKRQPDASDRRKVVVTPLPATEAVAMFEPLRRKLAKLNDRYSTAELALLADYLEQTALLMKDHAAFLRSSSSN